MCWLSLIGVVAAAEIMAQQKNRLQATNKADIFLVMDAIIQFAVASLVLAAGAFQLRRLLSRPAHAKARPLLRRAR